MDNVSRQSIESIKSFVLHHYGEDVSDTIAKTIKAYLIREKEIPAICEFFDMMYDQLYYEIIFKKVKIRKKIARQLEKLAGPLYIRTVQQRESIIQKAKK